MSTTSSRVPWTMQVGTRTSGSSRVSSASSSAKRWSTVVFVPVPWSVISSMSLSFQRCHAASPSFARHWVASANAGARRNTAATRGSSSATEAAVSPPRLEPTRTTRPRGPPASMVSRTRDLMAEKRRCCSEGTRRSRACTSMPCSLPQPTKARALVELVLEANPCR